MTRSGTDIAATVVLAAESLGKTFEVRDGLRRRRVRAVDGVSLRLSAGEAVAVVGESGCGKTTLARMLVGLTVPTLGTVRVGEGLRPLRPGRFRPRDVQMVFQDPTRSLNPRMRIGAIIQEPLEVLGWGSREGREERAAALLRRVGLDAALVSRFPHELSGGQRQRVGIARALATDPKVLICDEPVSALDVSVQASILALLREECAAKGTAVLLITHDLAVVRQVADRAVVMYLGRVVESGRVDDVLGRAAHPYTQALLESVPRVEGAGALKASASGEPADPSNPPSGCAFHPRCPIAVARCRSERPELEAVPGTSRTHYAACFESRASQRHGG